MTSPRSAAPPIACKICFYHSYRIDPIIAVVDWELAASMGQTVSLTTRKRKNPAVKEFAICLYHPYGVPAINTWSVGRHLALLDKIIKKTITAYIRPVIVKTWKTGQKI